MSTVTQQLGGFEKSIGKVSTAVKGMLVGFAATQAVSAIKSVVSAASDAQQSIGATETVFGKFADSVVKDSKRAATQYGLDANTYRENANLLGALFSNQGVSSKKLAGATKEMISVGADLSATFGGTTTDSVQALSAAFKGEYDSLERYGISLKESTVSAELAARGQDKLTGAALAAAKQQVVTDLIMKQSAKTRGAFAKENGTLAHQQQVLSAQFTNLKATIGTALLPILTRVLTFINANLNPAFKRLKPAVDVAKDAFKAIGDALQPVGEWFQKHPEVIKGIGIALGVAAAAAAVFAVAMGAIALVTSPIVLVVAAIAAIGGAIGYAYKNSEKFRNGVNAVVERLKAFGQQILPIIQQVPDYLKEKWAEFGPTVMGVFENVKTIVVNVFLAIQTQIQRALAVITTLWDVFGSTILSFVGATFGNIATLIGGVMDVIAGIIKTVSSLIRGDWSGAWNGIKQIVSGALQVIKAIISQVMNVIKTVISGAWAAAKALTSAAWNAMKGAVQSGVSAVMGFVRGIPNKITSALSGLGNLLVNAGKALLDGLKKGIEAGWETVKGVLKGITDKIPDWKGPEKRDKKLLKQSGIWIMESLVDGFKDGAEGVQKALGDITDKIEGAYKNKKKGAQIAKQVKKAVSGEVAALKANANAQVAVNKALEEATKNLEDLKKARADYAKSVSDSILGFGSVTNLNSAFNSDAMLQQMRERLAKAREFARIITDLKNKGLNQAMLDDLVRNGVEGSLATATAIAEGGAAAVAEFNSLQVELGGVATTLGETTASYMYDAGIQAAQGLVNGLASQAAALEQAADALAKAMIKRIKKLLKIKSPSRVFRALGKYTVEGMRIGLSDTSGVQKAMTNLSNVMTGSFDPALTATATAADAGGTTTVQVTVNVPATADKAAIGREVASALDAYYQQGGRRLAV